MRSRSKGVLLALGIGGALAASVALIVFAQVGGGRAGQPVAEAPSPNDAVFTIGRWEFRIPSGYVRMAGKDGASLDAVGLDFKPKSAPWIGPWGDHMLMLVEPKPAAATLQTWLTIYLDSVKPYHAEEKQYDLERFTSDNLTDNGLFNTNDVFVDRDAAGNIQTVLSCDRPGTVEYPGCEERYISEAAMVDIGFSREHLPLWNVIKENLLKFLHDHGRKIP